MYLYHILSRDKDTLIRKIYEIQKLSATKFDWYSTIMSERNQYGITLTDAEIQAMSKHRFKTIVNSSINKFAFTKLINSAKNQSKCDGILKGLNANKIHIQKYLLSGQLNVEEQQLLYILRSNSFNVKQKFSYLFKDDMKCRACEDNQSEESVMHFVLHCSAFKEERNGHSLHLEDIFGPSEKQISFIKIFKHIARKWKLILEIT